MARPGIFIMESPISSTGEFVGTAPSTFPATGSSRSRTAHMIRFFIINTLHHESIK
jgi:hypothetical protein